MFVTASFRISSYLSRSGYLWVCSEMFQSNTVLRLGSEPLSRALASKLAIDRWTSPTTITLPIIASHIFPKRLAEFLVLSFSASPYDSTASSGSSCISSQWSKPSTLLVRRSAIPVPFRPTLMQSPSALGLSNGYLKANMCRYVLNVQHPQENRL
ncbi:hypothetical protein Hypma_000515 [Hypsizygus marmoreus]|uniref:Uncharacterized protein n=1 Tax=Hypsizygus marmoreus TaxID=39966 RepID=A0A369J8X3_HYPMA|nr:hypothetical protein Hypma_000515 [Hypsizygus marmoreus]